MGIVLKKLSRTLLRRVGDGEGGRFFIEEYGRGRGMKAVICWCYIRFGHQDGVSSMDCLQRERPVTAGSSDQTLRVWKVVEESQLVFNGHKYAIRL